MTALLLALAVITASQGSAIELTFPNQPGLKSVEVNWQNKKVPAVLVGDKWVTVIGVDLDLKAGEQKANVLLTMDDGRIEKQETVVKVERTKFPTTELTVEDKMKCSGTSHSVFRFPEARARTSAIEGSSTKNLERRMRAQTCGRRPVHRFTRRTVAALSWRKIFSSLETRFCLIMVSAFIRYMRTCLEWM